MTSNPDLSILRHLATRTHASAAEIGEACTMAPAEVRARRRPGKGMPSGKPTMA